MCVGDQSVETVGCIDIHSQVSAIMSASGANGSSTRTGEFYDWPVLPKVHCNIELFEHLNQRLTHCCTQTHCICVSQLRIRCHRKLTITQWLGWCSQGRFAFFATNSRRTVYTDWSYKSTSRYWVRESHVTFWTPSEKPGDWPNQYLFRKQSVF